MARKPNRPAKAYRPRGIFAVSEKKKSRLPTLLEFLNPLSMPPESTEKGPTWRDVIVPPESTSPPVNPPGLLEFLNPFSAPPGQTPTAEPIGYHGSHPMGGHQPYGNDMPEFDPRTVPQLPSGWMPSGQPQAAPQAPPGMMAPPPDPQFYYAPNWRLPAKRPGAKRQAVT